MCGIAYHTTADLRDIVINKNIFDVYFFVSVYFCDPRNACYVRQFAKLLVNRIRKSVYSILAVNCLYRAARFICASSCLYACVLAIWVDTSAYMKFRTSVVVDQGNLSSLEFPALTICNNQA